MKKVLLIFDLNHTLLYAAKNSKTLTFDYNSKIQDSKPNCFMEKDKILSLVKILESNSKLLDSYKARNRKWLSQESKE